MPTDNYPSLDYLRQCVREENGRLFWLVRPLDHFLDERTRNAWNTRLAGKEAGRCAPVSGGPRWVVSIGGKHLYRNMVVYALHVGRWHRGIDHINRDKLDDRIENLRVATQSQNHANVPVRCHSSSGIKGVRLRPHMKAWTAQISINGKSRYLGSYPTREEAAAVYAKAAQEHFGEFYCAG